MKKIVKKTEKYKRPSWDEYFLKIVDAVGARATCDKSGSGCVLAEENRIVATGYTGSLSGLPHCNEVGHDLKNKECVRTIHAEHNAITQALKFGILLEGATMYCERKPCSACAKMANSLGIKKIITASS
ncbi:MAG: deaminase [Minisyncoccia bacterium]